MPGAGLADGSGAEQELFWRDRRWWRRAGQTSVGLWGATAVAFLATVVAARALGPEEFGQVVLAVSVATLVATLLDLTLEDAVVYHGFQALQAGHMRTLRALIRSSLSLDIAIGVLVAGAIVAFAEPLADLASGGSLPPGILRIAALIGLAATADGTTGGLLLVAGRPDLRAWIMLLSNTGRLAGVLIAVQAGGGPEAVVTAYAAATAIGSVCQAFLAWRLGWRRWRERGLSGGEPVGARTLLSFGFHASLATTLFSGRELLIPILLGSLSGPAAVGMFRVALLPVTAVSVLGGPVRLLLLPEQTKLAASNRFETLWRSIRLHFLGGLAIGVPGAVAGWFLLDTLIPLIFTEDFEGAVDAARILLVAAVAQMAGSWWKTLPTAVGMPQLRTLVATCSLALTIALLAFLGDQGVEGAALAFTLATVTTGLAWLVMARVLLRRAQARADVRDAPGEPMARVRG